MLRLGQTGSSDPSASSRKTVTQAQVITRADLEPTLAAGDPAGMGTRSKPWLPGKDAPVSGSGEKLNRACVQILCQIRTALENRKENW